MNFDFEQILSISPNPYVLLDTDLVIVWMNEAYLRVTGSERETIVGRQIFDAFPSEGESYRQLADSFARVLDTGEGDEIATIRYDIKGSDGEQQVRYWSATHTPILEAGELRFILQHTVDITELEGLRRSRDEMGVIERANRVQHENLTLKDQTKKLLGFFNQAPGFTAVLIGPQHRFGMANEAYCKLVGREDLIGKTVVEALPEIDEQGFVEILDRVYETGEAYLGHQRKVSLLPDIESGPDTRYLNFVFQPMRDDDQIVRGIIVQGHDVTDEIVSLEQQKLMVNELNHRVKNTLAIVQGLAMQSFRGSEAASSREVFLARLKNLSEAHNLLTEGFWGEAELGDVLEKSILAAAGEESERIDHRGEPIQLAPQVAVSFAMIVHELCTNAIKYGALSNREGRISVVWEKEDSGFHVFRWKETGGPAISGPPDNRGFGTRLIARGLGDQSAGQTDIAFEPDGISFIMRISAEGA